MNIKTHMVFTVHTWSQWSRVADKKCDWTFFGWTVKLKYNRLHNISRGKLLSLRCWAVHKYKCELLIDKQRNVQVSTATRWKKKTIFILLRSEQFIIKKNIRGNIGLDLLLYYTLQVDRFRGMMSNVNVKKGFRSAYHKAQLCSYEIQTPPLWFLEVFSNWDKQPHIE